MKLHCLKNIILVLIIASTLSNAALAVSLGVPFFSQYSCGEKLLGPSDGRIWDYGCALTSAAMVFSYYGVPTSPCTLNDDLMALGGVFADDGSFADWDRIRLVSDGKVTDLERVSPFDMSDVDAALHQGYPVIVHVTFGETGSHFIVFCGNDSGEHYFYDPADENPILRIWPNGALGRVYQFGVSIRIYYGTSASQPVYFADDNLKEAVKKALGITTHPTEGDMLNLTSLTAVMKNISSLTGLEYAKNLSFLMIFANNISDISPLSGLTNLNFLELDGNRITNIGPLSGLTNLIGLYLSGNNIDDISPLSELTDLTSLSLGNNNISDINSLSKMVNLTDLGLEYNNINNIESLSGLERIEKLELYNNKISNISPLAGLETLVTLRLLNNNISNISPLANMTNLKLLELANNNISNIESLSNMTYLEVLTLYNNDISNIGPLSNLTNLKELHLYNNNIDNILPLSNLTNLWLLDIRNNKISDINSLSSLISLTYLDLANNSVSNIGSLSELTNLETLNLYNNNVSNIEALSGTTSLGSLILWKNSISDISPLEELTSLRYLNIRENTLTCEMYNLVIPQIYQNNSQLYAFFYDPMPAECEEPPSDDVYWLAKAIMNEARGETLTEQIAVGWTIINRLNCHSWFGDSIEEIVWNGYGKYWVTVVEPNSEMIDLAKRLLNMEFEDPTNGATHFFSPISQEMLNCCTGGPYPVPGTSLKAYYACWAEPIDGWEILNQNTPYYVTIKKENEWTPLEGIRPFYFMFYRPYSLGIRAEIKSPGELRVYDSEGRVTGLVAGSVVTQIPGSEYSDYTVTIILPMESFSYEVVGTGEGLYGLVISETTRREDITFQASGISTSPGAVHRYSIDWEKLSSGGEGVTLEVDSDGDEIFENIVEADNDLTSGEFALQTETVIDFDPDTLKINDNQRKYVTVYIELPEGFNVADIDVSSLTLNTFDAEISQALPFPTAIGDHDEDGILDLMVKFGYQDVIKAIEPGEQVIYLTGRLHDHTPLCGFDLIRVIL